MHNTYSADRFFHLGGTVRGIVEKWVGRITLRSVYKGAQIHNRERGFLSSIYTGDIFINYVA